MARLSHALAVAILLLGCAACSGGGSSDADAPSTVSAIPDTPHVDGPIAVQLQPALTLPAPAPCEPNPEQHILCSPGGTRTFKALGDGLPVTIAEVGTAPSTDHTSWTTTVRFDQGSGPAVKQVARQTGGLGGLVLVVDGTAGSRCHRPRRLWSSKSPILWS